jgi:hypothetical protein
MGVAMSAETETAVGETGESECWCCGRVTSEEGLVRLGSHPEVGVCINCVVFLGRRARDHKASVMRQRLRKTAESIRGKVMSRGWHERPVIGPVLLWINRHVPW